MKKDERGKDLQFLIDRSEKFGLGVLVIVILILLVYIVGSFGFILSAGLL